MGTGHELVKVVHRAPGNSGRPLLLLLPGLSGNNRQWDLVVEHMGDSYCDIAFGVPILRHPAFGSTLPTVAQVAAAITAELKDLRYDHVVVASHSVGAFVAFSIGEQLRDRYVQLIPVNGGLANVAQFIDSPWSQFRRHPLACLSYLRLFLLVGLPVPGLVKRFIGSRRWSSRVLVGDLVSDAALATERQRLSLLEEAGHAGTLLALWRNRHYWRHFVRNAGTVPAPVLFIIGDSDPVASESDTRYMAKMLPTACVRILKGVGHAAPLEAPSVVAGEIREAFAHLA